MNLHTTHDPKTPGIHKRGEVTPTERRRMAEMLEDGFTLDEIAGRYDLSVFTVGRAIERYRRASTGAAPP